VIINGRQVGVGEGTNKKEAKRDACRVACEELGIFV
jgi:dsRNA-specific ribonuclease